MTELKEQLANKANNNVAPKESKKQGMEHMLSLMSEQIKAGLPEHVQSERFKRVALTAFNGNPTLQQCEPLSFIAAMMQSAQLGLEPNTPLGQAYLIPYGNKVQFQIGYKGLLELAQRTGKYKGIYAHEVYENDEFSLEYGLDPRLKHVPLLKGSRGLLTGYYAVYKLINGGEGFAYMTKDEVEIHRKRFSKANKSPWDTDFNEMAKKTVLKKLLKYAPLSIELQETVSIDEKVIERNVDKDVKDIINVGWAMVDEERED